MSNTLNFIIRSAQGAATPGAVTGLDPDVNSNQEIDTKYEAENALSYLSENGTIEAGGKT